tara:strand:+ start:659 stop:1108 length:450 start_codon:yes stop_codon:yes gene_type:complete
MPRIKLDPAGAGLVQSAGSDTRISVGGEPIHDIRTLTASTTLTRGGVYVLSGATSGLTVVLPEASTVAGSMFTFRAGGAYNSNILTASLSDAGTGTSVINEGWGSNLDGSGQWGQKLTMAAANGSSVSLLCDGVNFSTVTSSGSFTIAS